MDRPSAPLQDRAGETGERGIGESKWLDAASYCRARRAIRGAEGLRPGCYYPFIYKLPPPITSPQIPDHVPKTDYYTSGVPTSEESSKLQHLSVYVLLSHFSPPLFPLYTSQRGKCIHTACLGHTCNTLPPSSPAAPVYTARQIEGIRAACVAGREVLDLAAAAVRPGVTTDELDRVVRERAFRGGGGGAGPSRGGCAAGSDDG